MFGMEMRAVYGRPSILSEMEPEMKLLNEQFGELFYNVGLKTLDSDEDDLQSIAFDEADKLSLLLEGDDLRAVSRKACEVAIWNLAIARRARQRLNEWDKHKRSR